MIRTRENHGSASCLRIVGLLPSKKTPPFVGVRGGDCPSAGGDVCDVLHCGGHGQGDAWHLRRRHAERRRGDREGRGPVVVGGADRGRTETER